MASVSRSHPERVAAFQPRSSSVCAQEIVCFSASDGVLAQADDVRARFGAELGQTAHFRNVLLAATLLILFRD